MSGQTPPSQSEAGAPESDPLIVDGLERALAQARTKLPDHDHDPDVVLPTPGDTQGSRNDVAAGVAVDSSAVMDVLRGAIARYTTEDARDQGTWSDAVPLPDARPGTPAGARHAKLAYEPDRRRLAVAVVVLFLLVGGFGYQQFGIGASSSVKTGPTSTIAGHGVTTLARLVTTVPPTAATEAPPPETAAPTQAGTHPATTVHHSATTSPPATDPPPTDPTTTEPPTTESTTTTAPTTTTCDTIACP